MVTDDYGNKLSVKKKPDGTFGRRHTLSQGRKRAIALGGDSVSDGLMLHAKKIKNHAIYRKDEKVIPINAVSRRHATSAVRRRNLGDAYRKTMNEHPQARKRNYHSARVDIDLKKYNGNEATAAAKELHTGTKRKPKDFTK